MYEAGLADCFNFNCKITLLESKHLQAASFRTIGGRRDNSIKFICSIILCALYLYVLNFTPLTSLRESLCNCTRPTAICPICPYGFVFEFDT